MRPLGWAIVGCGRVAENRMAPAVCSSPHARLIGFCSRSIERARAFAQRFDAPLAADGLDALVRDDRVDIVYVATPNHQHAEQTIACLAGGKHVITDKPMALTVEDGRRMREAARAARRTLGLCHQQRFHPAHTELFRLAAVGALGHLTVLRVEMGFVYAPAPVWRQDRALAGGGPGMDLAPHAVDILLQAAGPVSRVSGWVGNVRFDYGVEDVFLAQLEFERGGLALLEMTYCSHSYGGRLEVRGDEGSYIVEGSLMASQRYESRLLSGPSRTPVEIREAEFSDAFRMLVDDFSLAVRDGRDPSVTAEDGLSTLAAIAAAYDSARLGRPVVPAPVD